MALVWVFLRGVTASGSAQLGIPYPDSLIGSPIIALWLTFLVVVIVRIDLWRRSELIFLANLGYSFGGIATLVIAECTVFELALRLAVV